jgi:hypothetical protein
MKLNALRMASSSALGASVLPSGPLDAAVWDSPERVVFTDMEAPKKRKSPL